MSVGVKQEFASNDYGSDTEDNNESKKNSLNFDVVRKLIIVGECFLQPEQAVSSSYNYQTNNVS